MTFADKIIAFNKDLQFTGKLPEGIRIMNPFRESETAVTCSQIFYKKYYDDNSPRHLILGLIPAGLAPV